MAVQQVTFNIPSEIEKGLEEGTLFRYGGVIRDTKGAIVMHLKEEPVPKTKENVILDFAKKNKYIIIGTAVVTALAAVTAGIVYVVVKNKRNEDEEVPVFIADFNKAFEQYLNSIKSASVSEDDVNNVVCLLKEIQKNQENGIISIDFSIENLNTLVDAIKDYTIKLSNANSFEITQLNDDNKDKIAQLQLYLEIQKQIFEKSA